MARSEEVRLVFRAKRGETEAFRELVDLHKDRLFGFVWRMLRDHHEAEDVCQNTFVRAYESLHSYSEAFAFSTWLYTIAYRVCLNTLRKKRPRAADLDLSALRTSDDDALAVAESEEARRLRRLVWSAVERLSAPQKSAVLLFYREGKSCQEIGLVLGIPPVTVKSHLHRARARLKDLLAAELGDEWRAEYLAG
jgi:RNA polymerase sigma-70 factor (ECF subfamily)